MDMRIYFPGGKRVFADYNGFTHQTDQRYSENPEPSAPAPFEMFLVSIGTCAGIYVLSFCQKRGIDTEGIELTQTHQFNPATHMIEKIDITIQLPASFPEKYHQAVILAANQCLVKKHLEIPPAFQVKVKTA